LQFKQHELVHSESKLRENSYANHERLTIFARSVLSKASSTLGLTKMAKDSEVVIADDGFIAPIVGDWAEKKYSLISYYAQIFSESMKKKWDSRAYIDLFAGAGRAKIKNSAKYLDTSSMLAAKLQTKFDKYIFCDLDEAKMHALQGRMTKVVPDLIVDYVNGDSNKSCKKILEGIPKHGKGRTVLSFCVVDPFNLANLDFNTIRELSKNYMDFLVLIPSCMDGRRNLSYYLPTENATVEKFLGDPNWRTDWAVEGRRGLDFGDYLTQKYCRQMQTLQFLDSSKETVVVKLPEKNVSLYHLAFFSKNQKGMDFWKQARKYTDRQTNLFG
jgi:three-Cys-motif partner protein